MNYRINTNVIIAVVVLVLLATGLFIYTLVSTPAEMVVETTPVTQDEDSNTQERVIVAKHQFIEGTHALAGMVELPTPCHRLIAEPFLIQPKGTTTDVVPKAEVRFSTLLEGEACPNEPFETSFYVSFDAPEQVTIGATWNGDPARLSLIPVGPDEVLDSEVYTKG